MHVHVFLYFSPHPYLFFNSDHATFTFLGFYVDANNGNLLEPGTNRVLPGQRNVISKELLRGLQLNHVPLLEDFDGILSRYKLSAVVN